MREGTLVIALVLLLACASSVFAQVTTGTIRGRVVSDRDGRFIAPFLVPGTYALRAELQGFRPLELQGVEVRLDQTVELDLALVVDALTDTVVVVHTVPVVDTTSTTTGINLDAST